MERTAYVLDVLPQGRSGDRPVRHDSIALAVGQDELKLLEIVLRPGTTTTPGTRLPLVGPDGGPPPPPVDHVHRRLAFPELTTAAQLELPPALERLVLDAPERFLKFINEADAVSRRFHLLELLPGIGKKTMLAIVSERRKAPFASFADMEARLKLKHPERLVVGRIEKELKGEEDKYRLFVLR